VTEPAVSFARLAWECAQLLGLSAAAGVLLLTLVPVRPRRPPTGLLTLRRHELIGWLITVGAFLHAAVALLSDHTVLEHLKLSAPWYEWCGIGALALLAALSVPATARLRRRLWTRHRSFQALHVSLGCLLVVLLAAHLITTARYLHGSARTCGWVLLSLGALLALLRVRSSAPPSHAGPVGPLSHLAFGRHVRIVLVVVVLSGAALLPLLSYAVRLALRAPLAPRATTLPLDFPHEKHRDVNCIACHHNFRDNTGMDACISCHRSARATIKVSAEARFHDFCLGCHRDPPAPLTHHGPLTGCEACHHAEGTLLMSAGGGSGDTPDILTPPRRR
jgi:predicted CXXCH cytochrome family protein